MALFSTTRSILGVDIGTSYIKAVQLKKSLPKPQLESYGIVQVSYPSDTAAKIDMVRQTAEILKMLYDKAQFSAKKVVMSLPTNVAFVSVLSFPPMSEKEIQRSVEYKARKYVPLPLSEVNLGWQILEGEKPSGSGKGGDAIEELSVLLTAVPKNVVNNYLRVIQASGLEPQALEIESLSLIRALVRREQKNGILIIDVGAKATSLSLVHNGFLWVSRHLNIGGDTITSTIARSMGISFGRADQFKRTSLTAGPNSPAGQLAKSVIDVIKSETQQLIRIAENQGKKISKIILTGGGANLSGLEKEFASLSVSVELGRAEDAVSYEPALESKLVPLSHQLAVAIGLALRVNII